VGAGREACIAIPSAITGETIANSFWIRDEPLPCPNPLAGATYRDARALTSYYTRYWGTSDDSATGFYYYGDTSYVYVYRKDDGTLVTSFYGYPYLGYRAEAYDDGTNTQIFGSYYPQSATSGTNYNKIGRLIYNRSTGTWGTSYAWLRVPSWSTTTTGYIYGMSVWNGEVYFSTYETAGTQVYKGPVACATATTGTPCSMTKWLPVGGGTGTMLTTGNVRYVMGLSVDSDNAYFVYYDTTSTPYYKISRYKLSTNTLTVMGSNNYHTTTYQNYSVDNPDADADNRLDWFWYHDYYSIGNGAAYDGKIRYLCNPSGPFTFFGNAIETGLQYLYTDPMTYDMANDRLGMWSYGITSGPMIYE
jgi:hypothetical protein